MLMIAPPKRLLFKRVHQPNRVWLTNIAAAVEENLALFADMKAGKYPDGAKVLRAKVDLASQQTCNCATH
jgi:glutamyl/glutaminyl-tRNA synthetase